MARAARTIDRSLVAYGLLCLLLGAAVYVFARVARAAFLPAGLHWPVGALGALGGALPTFAHSAAFSILTASALGAKRRRVVAACGAWTAVNVLLEIGQHASVSPRLAALLPSWFDRVWLLDATRGYFLNGTFDFYDIGAAVAGGLLAAVLMLCPWRRGER